MLKNAFDNVFVSFALRNKPMAAVGYSSGIAGGARAVEHLAHVAIEADMAPLRSSVLIPFVNEAFDSEGHRWHFAERLSDIRARPATR